MKALKIVYGMLGFFVSGPIWFYLLYQILVRVHATELMMFLFWVYLPVTVLISLLMKIEELGE